jgi:hypothetical protein
MENDFSGLLSKLARKINPGVGLLKLKLKWQTIHQGISISTNADGK